MLQTLSYLCVNPSAVTASFDPCFFLPPFSVSQFYLSVFVFPPLSIFLSLALSLLALSLCVSVSQSVSLSYTTLIQTYTHLCFAQHVLDKSLQYYCLYENC